MKKNSLIYKIIAVFALLHIFFITESCGRSKHDREFDAVADEKPIEANYSSVDNTPAEKEIQDIESGQSLSTIKNDIGVSVAPGRLPVRNIGQLHKVFNDSNHLQLQYARTLGIDPIYDIRDAYRTRRPVVYVKSNDYYHVDSLKHSLPFLVPEAEKLLQEIGKNFIDTLKSRGGSGYIIKVTSMLRTPVTVNKLRRVNINATQTSTHQFGTTFDISYTQFYPVGNPRELHDGDLKNLLAEVLADLRAKGRCLVKFEKKTSCFHVTVKE